MNSRVHIIISGRVQGVFFRSNAAKKASEIGVTGWIRNLRDGSVEAIFEGNKKALEEIIDFCKIGPPGALVKNIELKWEPSTSQYRTFNII